MRFLLVVHPPLLPSLGAAQIALELGAALRELGQEVAVYSCSDEAARGGEGRRRPDRTRELERFIEERGPFDVVDLPANTISERIAASNFVVARSVQPELAYRSAELREAFRRSPFSPRLLLSALRALAEASRHRTGWARADLVLCLGARELEQMKESRPALSDRLAGYEAAPSPEIRGRLRALRAGRSRAAPETLRKLIWIGRWAAHKGTATLLAVLDSLDRTQTVTVAGCGQAGRVALAGRGDRGAAVRVLESFTREELPALLEGQDAGIFTSIVEGWGLSLQEMLEAGLPVFATRAGCVPDLEDHFPGRLISLPGRIEASRVGPLAVDWDEYERRFSWLQIARDYLERIQDRRSALE